jgi:F-box protein 9
MLIVRYVAVPRGNRGQTIEAPALTNNDSTALNTVGSTVQHSAPAQGIAEAIGGLSVEQNDAVQNADGESSPDKIESTLNARPRPRNTLVRTFQRPFGIGIILGCADYVSIAQLGRVCWKFHIFAQNWTVWRTLVEHTYHPPQIPMAVTMPDLIGRHSDDWRTTFLKQPRVRMNGAYIAAYHYTRPGSHPENVWVRVDHVVEFYRTLRFLPNGQVLSLLTTDAPSETLRRMEPTLRVKGFATGTWSLHADGLYDDELHARPPGAKIVVDDLVNRSLAGYTFRLVLKIDSRKGKWDKLEMIGYESINLKTGEVCALPMNHKKPFYFSVVRSYGI